MNKLSLGTSINQGLEHYKFKYDYRVVVQF